MSIEYNPIVDIFVEDESMKADFENTVKEDINMNENTNNMIDLTESATVSEESVIPAEEVVAETSEVTKSDEPAAEETTEAT